MVSVSCPCSECKHNGMRNKCKAENINLSFASLMTVHEGRISAWKCNMYELSDEAKAMEEWIKKRDKRVSFEAT